MDERSRETGSDRRTSVAELCPGTSVEEVYLVISGEGTAHVNDESAPLKKGDAVPVKVKEVHSFENTGTADMELIVYGVALEKGKLDINDAK